MTGQVENTRMTPMQTLDSLKNQINADGKVTQEEIQVFEKNCGRMVVNGEITDETFNEALGWFKNITVEEQSNTPMLDKLLADRARKDAEQAKWDSLGRIEQAKQDSIAQAEAKYQANYDRLGIKELEKELKAKKKRFNKLAKVFEEPNKTRKKSMIIGGVSGFLGTAVVGQILADKFDLGYVEKLKPFFYCDPYGKKLYYDINKFYDVPAHNIKTWVPIAAALIGLGIGYGVSKIISHNREKNRPQRIEEMRQLELEIHMLEQQIAELKAQC